MTDRLIQDEPPQVFDTEEEADEAISEQEKELQDRIRAALASDR